MTDLSLFQEILFFFLFLTLGSIWFLLFEIEVVLFAKELLVSAKEYIRNECILNITTFYI